MMRPLLELADLVGAAGHRVGALDAEGAIAGRVRDDSLGLGELVPPGLLDVRGVSAAVGSPRR